MEKVFNIWPHTASLPISRATDRTQCRIPAGVCQAASVVRWSDCRIFPARFVLDDEDHLRCKLESTPHGNMDDHHPHRPQSVMHTMFPVFGYEKTLHQTYKPPKQKMQFLRSRERGDPMAGKDSYFCLKTSRLLLGKEMIPFPCICT